MYKKTKHIKILKILETTTIPNPGTNQGVQFSIQQASRG